MSNVCGLTDRNTRVLWRWAGGLLGKAEEGYGILSTISADGTEAISLYPRLHMPAVDIERRKYEYKGYMAGRKKYQIAVNIMPLQLKSY